MFIASTTILGPNPVIPNALGRRPHSARNGQRCSTAPRAHIRSEFTVNCHPTKHLYGVAAISWAGLAPVGRVLARSPPPVHNRRRLKYLLKSRSPCPQKSSASYTPPLRGFRSCCGSRWQYLFLASACALYAYIFASGCSEESLLIIHGLGL